MPPTNFGLVSSAFTNDSRRRPFHNERGAGERRPSLFEQPDRLLGLSTRTAAGLPVGSGLIESGHKHVLQARLKKGEAWLISNVELVANLRVLRANRQWLNLWN